ncbi:zinc dependent phospholipase C family protein [Paradesertivirga mongoliensis]|uniref:Zinc dependent phospholipase C family protein n=1 Tax=Paradesertivirga mongoliensis TaxID=2100740 RepID=A0ABW4ZGX3_9SPHI|nr:zinc dependent phospholipase C family protein [Pedobacter mongoliensis]
MTKKITTTVCLLAITLLCSSWGFFAHKKINRLAVFTLPQDMIKFYKDNISYLTEHAVDADKRRYADSAEAARHYLDADHYGERPFDSIPQKWQDAVKKFSEDTVKAYGIVPWQIQRSYNALVRAFIEKDAAKVLKYSSDLGHYVSDAHVPLHTTENYNGQLSGQTGIHGFWESRLPELFAHEYDFFVGKAKYIENPLKEAWTIVSRAYSYKDSVLGIEARLSRSFPSDRRYSFSERNGRVVKTYSEEYSAAYHQAMNGMVERQMRASILATGCFWYSAWIDAGQPDVRRLNDHNLQAYKVETEQQEKLFEQGKIIGRTEGDD